MPVITAVAYARYSSDKQQESSIVVQLAAIKQFCQRHNVQLVREYVDEAQTGTSANRINFQKMVNDAQLKDFQYIIVHRMDRWARNVDDARYYKKYFKKYGIKIISAIEEFDDSPEGEFFELISLGIAEMYSKKLAREAKAGVMANAREGKAHSGTPPIGYAKKDKRYVLVEEEAKAVKIMFEMAAEGYGYTAIAKYLNSNGYRRANGKLYSNHLHDILRNREYTGEYIFNKGAYRARNEPYNSHKERPSSEIIRIPHGMPQIISYELFNKVQSLLDARKKPMSVLRSNRKVFLLSSLCTCGICGNSVTCSSAVSKEKRVYHYCCSHKKIGCNGKAINAEYIEDYILSLLADCLLLPRNYDNLCELIKTCYINASDELNKKSDMLLCKIREIEEKIKEYRQAQADGDKCINNIIEGNIHQLEVEKGDRLYEKENIDGNITMFPSYNVKTISRFSKVIRDMLESQDAKERRNGIIKMIYRINIDNDYVKSIINFQELLNLPYFISWVIVAAMLNQLLTPYGGQGPLNKLIQFFSGSEEPEYIYGAAKAFYPIVLLSNIWKGIGWGSIVYLAAISQINAELYEAARLDGAGRFRMMASITLPCISNTIGLLFILSLGGIMSAGYDQIYVLQTPANYKYSNMQKNNAVEYFCGVIFFINILFVFLIA